jgi:hypothetical protein
MASKPSRFPEPRALEVYVKALTIRDVNRLAQHLETVADAKGVVIVEAPLRQTRGAYLPFDKGIGLHDGLNKRERLTVLAHEVGHMLLGHLPIPERRGLSTPQEDAASRRQELAADRRGLKELRKARNSL